MNKLLILIYLSFLFIFNNSLGQENLKTYVLSDTVKAIACYDSAGIYFKKADHRNARRNYTEALKIYKSLFGEEGHKSIASIYQKIAILELGAYHNKLAMEDIYKGLKINKTLCGEVSKETASSLGFLGIIYSRLEIPDKAEYFFNKAIQIYIHLFGESNSSVASCYNNLGNIYRSKNDYDKALECQNKALNIRLKIQPSNPEDIAASYNNLASVFYDKGDYDLALEYEKKGLTIKQTIFDENHPAIAWSYNNMGSSYFSKGDYGKALAYHRKAMYILFKTPGINPPDIGSTYVNIGNVYKQMNKFDSALFYQQKALDINLKMSEVDHHNIASIYNDLGDTYFKIQQYDSAIANFSRALKIEKQILYKPHPQIAEYLNNLAEAYLAKDLCDKANDCLDTALIYNLLDYNTLPMPDSNWLNRTIDHKIMMHTLLGKANEIIHAKVISEEKLQKALVYAKQALLEAEKAKFEITSENSKLYMGEDVYEICDIAIKVLYKLYNQTHSYSYFDQAFYFFEKPKASILYESVLGPKILLQSGVPEQILQKERSYRSNITYYETKRKLLVNTETSIVENSDSILFALKSRYKDYLDSINVQYPVTTLLAQQSKQIGADEIKKGLSSYGAIIEYFTGKEKTYAIVITPENSTFVELPVDTSLTSTTKKFMIGIRKNNIELAYKNGKWLYKTLLEPLLPMIKKTNKLLIIPDQTVSMVPFETIITGGSSGKPSYLIEKYAITYQLSASIWLNKMKSIVSEQQSKRSLLDFAGFAPVFKRDNLNAVATQREGFAEKYGSDTTFFEQLRSQQYFKELPNSGEEVTQIASLFKQANQKADTYTYGQASKSAFKTEGVRYNILHIATHAFANNIDPELSWLAFANTDSAANASKDGNGILYAGEMYGLTLNASLIVLSACETGLGKVIKGEGVMSLSRSLMFAGASNIILSLWKVGDLDTKLLMVEFYKAYLSGKSYTDALRTAKLTILKKNPNPKSWAGFVLFGL